MKKHVSDSGSDNYLSVKKALKTRLRSEVLNYYRRAFGNFLVLASLSGLPAFVNAEDRIPTGFRLERYLHVWEHNPFTLVAPTPSKSQPSPFEKLFLTSWLRDCGKDVVIVQNSETNAIQRITTEPNQNSVCLIEMRLNPNPRLVEAIISDGKEKGGIKFRFDVQSPAAQAISGAAELQSSRAKGQDATPTAVSLQAPSREPAALPNAHAKSFPAVAPQSQAIVHRYHPGIPRVHTEGLPDATSSTQDASGGAALPTSPPDQQSLPDQS